MDKQSLPSIEKFAAYLDGKLSPDEMQQFSQLAEHNDALRQLLDASARLDELMADSTDMDLPPEIASSEFEIPQIPTHYPLQFESIDFGDDGILAAASLYTEDDFSQFETINMNDDHAQGDQDISVIPDSIETDIDIDPSQDASIE